MTTPKSPLTLQYAIDALMPVLGLCRAGQSCCGDGVEYESFEALFSTIYQKVDEASSAVSEISFNAQQGNELDKKLAEFNEALARHKAKQQASPASPSLKINAHQHVPIFVPENGQTIQDLTDRTRRHRALLEAAAFNTVGATLHDANPETGYQYLDVVSPIPQRQNRPTIELIGQPCTIVDPRIGEPRLHAIERALKHGQVETYEYEYEDDYRWKFIVKVAPLYGSGEVLTVVHDAASWQRPHWENKIFGAPDQ